TLRGADRRRKVSRCAPREDSRRARKPRLRNGLHELLRRPAQLARSASRGHSRRALPWPPRARKARSPFFESFETQTRLVQALSAARPIRASRLPIALPLGRLIPRPRPRPRLRLAARARIAFPLLFLSGCIAIDCP